MSLYSLSIFFETPQADRKGRLPYIVASLAISLLSLIISVLSVENAHDIMIHSKGSGILLLELYLSNVPWQIKAITSLNSVSVFIADSILVSRVSLVRISLFDSKLLTPLVCPLPYDFQG